MALNLVDIAKAELALWRSQGLVECVRHPVTRKPLGNPAAQPGSMAVARYWREGVGDNQRNGCMDVAWSAAFVSWCLRQAGVPLDAFPFSASHQTYIRWAIRNSRLGKPGKLYYGMRVDTYRPQPGDLIAQWRKARADDPDPDISFDHQPDTFYPSHCDIVVSATAARVVAIGGNLDNRVKETRFGAVDGILKPKKELICVMRLVSEGEG